MEEEVGTFEVLHRQIELDSPVEQTKESIRELLIQLVPHHAQPEVMNVKEITKDELDERVQEFIELVHFDISLVG